MAPDLLNTGVESVAPALRRLLARATRAPISGAAYADMLAAALATDAASMHALANAATMRLGDGGEADAAVWLRADPVHLRADRDRVVLDATLTATAAEAQALAQSFNESFAADGLLLEPLRPARWYLRAAGAASAVAGVPPTAIVGANIEPHLPAGPDGMRFKRLINETQMLFHAHPVNAARRELGQPVINSLWLWGGGTLGKLSVSDRPALWADEPLARGLWRLLAGKLRAAPATLGAWLEDPDALALQSTDAAVVAFERPDCEAFERDWAAPLLEAIRQRCLARAVLYPGNGWAYATSAGALRRVWRRVRPLPAYRR